MVSETIDGAGMACGESFKLAGGRMRFLVIGIAYAVLLIFTMWLLSKFEE